MANFELRAPAKVNLMLKVTGRRDDGYHDLQSLMLPLSVGDSLKVRASSEPSLQISCNDAEIPVGPDSLLGKAFRFAAERLGYAGGLELELEKQLPVGAGLGGGSSDAAAVVRAVERLTDQSLPKEVYPELAYQVGADVPFFMTDGAQWVSGIGELVRPCAIQCPLYLLLVNPGIHISTQAVYADLAKSLTSYRAVATVPPSFETLADLLPFITNDLESVVLTPYPVIAELKTELLNSGADAALMSGSGSTVFGLYSQIEKRDGALQIMRAKYPQFWMTAAEALA